MIFSYPTSLCLDNCYGAVYCLTNLRDGKRYVGIAKTGRIKRRLAEHRTRKERYKENPHLFRAMNRDDFKHEIIDTAATEKELFDKEKMYIASFKSSQAEFGYNLTIGGDGRTPYFRPYAEAREYTRSLGFKNTSEWYKWVVTDQRPQDIPSNPSVTYRGIGWTTWKDYIGTGRKPRTVPWMSYEQARAIVAPIGLREKEYRKWCKENTHLGVPLKADRVYKGKGWQGWGHYLGTQKSALQHLLERNADPEFQKRAHAARWSKQSSE